MSYHRALGQPPVLSTQMFAEAVDPYSNRFSPPGAIYSPYGWGPDFTVGMPMNYTHHAGYTRERIPGVKRPIGTLFDRLQGLGSYLGGLGSTLVVL